MDWIENHKFLTFIAVVTSMAFTWFTVPRVGAGKECCDCDHEAPAPMAVEVSKAGGPQSEEPLAFETVTVCTKQKVSVPIYTKAGKLVGSYRVIWEGDHPEFEPDHIVKLVSGWDR